MPETLRPIVPVLLAFALSACGEAVTNPTLEGFPSDPRVVQGDWVTLHSQANGTVLELDGELVPAGGRFLGRFEFNRFGQFWGIQFTDGTWDGTRVRFSANMTIDGLSRTVEWIATFFPAGNGEPAMLLLSSDPFGGPANPFVYLRPQDVP